jgi:glycosyltransferase involved in cell wall biosynthesis
MKRVLYFTPFPPAASGIADYAARFREVIESNSEWRLDPESLDDLPMNSMSGLRQLRRRISGWVETGRLDSYSMLHAEIGYKQLANLEALRVARKLRPRIPYCVTVHDPPLVVAPALYPFAMGSTSVFVRHALRALDSTPLARGRVGGVLEGASRVFALSRAGLAALRKRFPAADVAYLPHVNLRHSAAARRNGSRSAVPVIFFLGFWGPSKGLRTLLDAVERLTRSESLDFRLRIAGGPDTSPGGTAFAAEIRSAIERSPARPHIELAGSIPAAELDSCFDGVGIFVMPYSHAPGLSGSGVLFRAAAAGVPVVATSAGTLPEHVVHERTGLVVQPDDPEALAGALARLLQDPELGRRLGEASRAHMERRHRDSIVAEQVVAAYEQVGRSL